MFEQKEVIPEPIVSDVTNNNNNKYKNIINSIVTTTTDDNSLAIDKLLEMEKQNNKNEQWNKLDKTVKIQKLHQYAEKYGKEHGFPVKDVKSLKQFLMSN